MSSESEKQPSAIDKIRAEVSGIKKEHTQVAAAGRCAKCWHFGEKTWPCPTLCLAEDKMRLAEAIERAKSVLKDGDWLRGHMILEDGMAEVAR